ncbi:MAG: cobalamin-dependent protein, partial [Chloroflexota bacterium]
MDILYVHPAKQEADARFDLYKAGSPYPFIPVGVIGLVNMLRQQGWNVEGLNLPVELLLKPDFDFKMWLAIQSPAKLVMIDLHWYEHSFGAMDVAESVKKVWPNTPIVIGGLTATHFSFEIIRDFPAVDYIICGDSEEPLALLAKYIADPENSDISLDDIPNLVYRKNDEPAWNMRRYTATSEDLNNLDFVTTDWLHHHNNYAAVQCSGAGIIKLEGAEVRGHWLAVGRGCTFDCSYCGGGKKSHETLAGRDGYIQRDPILVVDDIEVLAEKGIQQIALSLDPATFKPKWWQALFSEIKKREIKVGLYNEFFQLPSK